MTLFIILTFFSVSFGVAVLFGLIYMADKLDKHFERRNEDETDIA